MGRIKDKLTALEEQLRLEDTGDVSHLYDKDAEQYEELETEIPSINELMDMGIDVTDYLRDHSE